MVCFQQSLFGKMLPERLYQRAGLILEPCSNVSQTPPFQCLLLDGEAPEWYMAAALISHGEPSTPRNISECHSVENASFLWQIIEENVLPKYSLSPAVCAKIMRYAAMVGCRVPEHIEALLLRQGGRYPKSTRFTCEKCVEPRSSGRRATSSPHLEGQTILALPS